MGKRSSANLSGQRILRKPIVCSYSRTPSSSARWMPRSRVAAATTASEISAELARNVVDRWLGIQGRGSLWPSLRRVCAYLLAHHVARISLDDPISLASAVPRLRELAGRGHRHITQRFWAAQTLLALKETGLFAQDAAEHRLLLRSFADDPSAAPVPAPPIPADDDDRAYQLPHNSERREASQVANASISRPARCRRGSDEPFVTRWVGNRPGAMP